MMKSAYTARIMEWMAKNYPATLLKGLMQNESTYNEQEREAAAEEFVNDPQRMALLQSTVYVAYILPAYPEAVETLKLDMVNYMEKIPLEEIKVPALICHGKCDADVPFSQAEQAH